MRRFRKLKGKMTELVKDYKKGIPLSELSLLYGCTRQSIWKAIKPYNIEKRRDPKKVDYKCANKYCDNMFQSQKKRRGKYCSHKCYLLSRSMSSILVNKGIKTNRAYRLEARKVSGAEKGQVVHHIDGDVSNNSPDNLMIFNNQSDHLKFHHSIRK